MTSIGIYLNDAALAVACQDQPVSVMPSIVHADPAHPDKIGSPAQDVARLTPRLVSTDHWTMLSRAGREIPLSVRSIIRSELRVRLAGWSAQEPMQCAVPSCFGPEELSVVLALMRAEGFDVGGFHDAAPLMVARTGLSGATIVMEMGLGYICASRVETDREVRRRASTSRRGPGLLAVHQCWLQQIAEAMVLQTRFDPLHEGVSEQRLYDDLDRAFSTAAQNGVAEIELPTPKGVARISVSRDQFAEAASSIYDEALAVLHELRPAGDKTNILIDERLLRFPGFLGRLASIRGCRVFSHSTGLASRAAAAERARADADGSVSIQRIYAPLQPIESPKEIDLSEFQSASDRPPTHALFEGKAIALPSGLLEIGRNPASQGLRLTEGLAGVSRLHCSLQGDESGVTLIPHSPQGVWLNDERVRGRVRVSSGDRLRIGTPGVVIDLIAVGGADHGASS
jgi:hypothetical protein